MERMSLWQIMVSGGPMMWPIFLCSVFAAVIVAERLFYLSRIKINPQEFLQSILDKVKRHQIKEALGFCDNTHSPIAAIFKVGILKYDRPRSQIKEAMEDASLYVLPQLDKNLVLLETIAHISPLLGLLGTLLGMAKGIRLLSGNLTPNFPAGIFDATWQAFLATIFGLVVSITSFLAYSYLRLRIRAIILEMDRLATEFLDFLTE